ncbi:MAG TPA: FkbM family methyltransferase [Candidatus Baltobacteraceae bacterium]|nr:FkbM family methyltransferase [Candidatus Baltobacteraceae bacterium]
MKGVEELTPYALACRLIRGDLQLLDVRPPHERTAGRIDDATQVPLDQLAAAIPKFDKSRPIATYCTAGPGGKVAATLLKSAGFSEVAYLGGGFDAWQVSRSKPDRRQSLRQFVWKLIQRLTPYVPRRIGGYIRHRLIAATKLAPLPLVIAKGDIVVQVGAVEGGELWEMVRLVGNRGRVIVIEPFAANVKSIERRLIREGIANVTVIPKGAWSEPGKQTLHIHPKSAGSHIILDSGVDHDMAMRPSLYAGSVEIDVERLDDLLAAHGILRCDFIKITVMGAELQVLKGMDRLLADARTSLWVKAHSLVEGHPVNELICETLQEKGFRTIIVHGNLGPGGIRSGDVFAAR